MARSSVFLFFVIIFLMAVVQTHSHAQVSQGITGLWLTQNERSVIKITECDKGLCGEIFWIIAGGMTTDSKNPNPDRRDRAMCGLQILWGFQQNTPSEWVDGKIYKADDGDTYNANLTMLEGGRLRVRGYIGIPLFGKTQIWTRANEKDYPACK